MGVWGVPKEKDCLLSQVTIDVSAMSSMLEFKSFAGEMED
jgi:hypothetical protein